MLHHLRVSNLGVLEDASIDPGPGFTVITGETGAGKTMLLGALRLLTGERPKTAAIGPFGEEARAEGLFTHGEVEIGVSRLVPREGKSRAYIDGALAAASVLEEKVGSLVEIVGQHDRLLLRQSQAILGLVDGRLDTPGHTTLRTYQEAWKRHRSAIADQRRLGGDRMGLERELDLFRYQADEISAAGLQPGDDIRMESMMSRLRNAGAVRENLGAASAELERLAEGAGEVVARLRKLAAIDPEMSGQLTAAEGLDALAHDLRRDVREMAETTQDDPAALEDLERRLTALGELKRKYGRTLDDVLAFGSNASRRVTELEDLLDQASTIDQLVDRTGTELAELADGLSEARREAANLIEEEARHHLGDLGLATASIDLVMERVEPGAPGGDRVEVMFASDHRLDQGRVADIASGGELSRLMLALRLATRAGGADTLVFDEVDAGVGGATALALGRKLADLGRSCQVLCVTHLPQVAAHASTQFLIERNGPKAIVRKVEGEERLTELSRMLAGLPESERGREAAAELLASAGSVGSG